MARRSSFFVRFLLIGVLAHLYVGVRLIPDAALALAPSLAAAVCLLASCVVIPQGMMRRTAGSQVGNDRIAWVGLMAMGLFSSLFVLTLVRDVMLLLAWAIQAFAPSLDMSGLRRGSALGVPALAVLASLVGLINARRRAPVVTVEVPIAGLPEVLHGFTIVQITDIHVGPTIKRGYVQAIVQAVNAERADLVAITGDVVDGSVQALSEHVAPLGQLRARHGVYMVTGNHEYYSGAQAWVGAFRQMGMHVLVNEHVAFSHQGAVVVVAGVTDYNAASVLAEHASDPVAAMSGAPADAGLRLLLAHQPRSAIEAQHVGYDLQISGHTHGGQFFPWGFFVRMQQPFTAGLHRLGSMWVYTSRGTGYWGPPKRLGAPSEITRVKIVRA